MGESLGIRGRVRGRSIARVPRAAFSVMGGHRSVWSCGSACGGRGGVLLSTSGLRGSEAGLSMLCFFSRHRYLIRGSYFVGTFL